MGRWRILLGERGSSTPAGVRHTSILRAGAHLWFAADSHSRAIIETRPTVRPRQKLADAKLLDDSHRTAASRTTPQRWHWRWRQTWRWTILQQPTAKR